MIVKTLLVMLAVIVVIMPDAEAGCKKSCSCRWLCYGKREVVADAKPGCVWHCSCGFHCSWGKRESQQVDDPSSVDASLELPSKMSVYDANKDGRISFQEFEKVLPHPLQRRSAKKTFNSLDKNGDGFITCKELGQIARGGKAEC
ncbi:uncharacterized protein LOC110244290 [Exaiptasia diaphana]|uniref:EF-hand domain-containing protein n=1 Tax=Exaiptasia diaphana TaxID=2652724 RepID=A0A913XLD1_EXADI|nr:uncharacterized protein LOC110244290 [Exaiptasia diaphana]